MLDFSDRQVNLIEEGIDLSIRITDELAPVDIVRKLSTARLLTVASPDYLEAHGRPRHPADLAQAICLGYSPQANNRPWLYQVDGRLIPFYVTPQMQANNGDALAQAAAEGLGIMVQPDFFVGERIASGELEILLESFERPPLGIYAMLPSNRHIPHNVRALLDFLAEQLIAS